MKHKLTPKDKAYLKGLANNINNRYLMGKDDIDSSFFDMLDKALEAHELIKVGILQNSNADKVEVADLLVKNLDCQIVQIIGRVIVIYRESSKSKKIIL